MPTDPLSLDAIGQAQLVRAGELSPAELVDAAIAAAEARNPALNAIIHERYDRARDEAEGDLPDGPFRGVPMVVKDLDGMMAGEPYHAGTRFLKRHGYVATVDTELIRRFRAAGFVIIGRTNTPELGLQTTTEPLAYGPSRNPWDPERSTGGSSGGSAAAVAAEIVAVGHAGDGGGSIRVPASMCGLVGLKPSRGRITMAPDGEAWSGLVARLVVTRTVRDTAAVLDAVLGPSPGDPYVASPPARPYVEELTAAAGTMRIGWTTAVPNQVCGCDPEVAATVGATAALLDELGHEVSEATPPWDDPQFAAHFVNAYGVWTAAELDHLGRLVGAPVDQDGVEPGTWAIAELGRTITGVQFQEAIEALHAFTRQVATYWEPSDGGRGFDVLVCPTVPEHPPLLGTFDGGPDNPLHGVFRSAEIVPFTAPFNTTGQPAMSLPVGSTTTGLPIGVQLVAALGREDLLLRLAAQLETARPWADRRPTAVPA